MNIPALNLKHLTVAYDNQPVIWDVSATIPSGIIVAIVGPNGAGKTTLLKTIIGLLKPVAGCVEIFGAPYAQQRQRVAYISQRSAVDWHFPATALDITLMGCYGSLGWFARPSTADIDRAWLALEHVGLTNYANTPIHQLSGGQQQRLFFARALMQDADLYLMDEPFASVDAHTHMHLIHLLHSLRNQGKTIVIVHHDLHTIATYFDWTLVLNKTCISYGPIQQTETPFSNTTHQASNI